MRSIIGPHPYKNLKRRPSYPGGVGSSSGVNSGEIYPPANSGSEATTSLIQEGANYSLSASQERGDLAASPITIAPIVPQHSETLDNSITKSSDHQQRALKSPSSSTSEPNTQDTDSSADFKPPTFMTAEPATSTTATTPQGAAPSGITPYGPLSVSTFLNPAGLPG